MKSSQPKAQVPLPCTWYGPSNHKLKERATVSSVRQPPNPNMAKKKVDQRCLVSREGGEGDGYLKQMEALKDEYNKNLEARARNESPVAAIPDLAAIPVAATHQDWEDWRVRQRQDMAAIAEIRGREAVKRLRGAAFVEEKARMAAKETKVGARLVEKLRSAEVVSRPRPAARSEIVDVVSRERVEIHDKRRSNKLNVGVVERVPLGDLGNKPKIVEIQTIPDDVKKREEHKEALDNFGEERREAALRQERLSREFNRMMLDLDAVTQTKLSDSTLSQLSERSLSPAYLSTILEATEDHTVVASDDTTADSLAMDDVDHEPVRGPSSAEDSAHRSATEASSDGSTNFNARITRKREKENDKPNDLDDVRNLLDRIRHQRNLIDERNEASVGQDQSTHFKTIEGLSQGQTYKNVNRDFVNKVLDFESNSILVNPSQKQRVNCWTEDDNSSLETTSTSRDNKQYVNKKLRKKKKQFVHEPKHVPINEVHNEVKKDEKPADEKQVALRGYIEKLLSMKHEEIANLSVSTLSSNKDSSESTLVSSLKSSLSTPTPYTSSHSSDSSGKKQVRFQFDTTKDDSSYLGLPIKRLKNKSDDSSYLSLPFTGKEKSYLNETATSIGTVYKELKSQPEHHIQQQKDDSIKKRRVQITPQTFEVNRPQSHAEIQALFRQKRQELTDQLKKLQLDGDSDLETVSEGPLTSSSSSSTSIDLLSSILERRRTSDISSFRSVSESDRNEAVEIERNGGRSFGRTKERTKDLTEVSMRSRKEASRHLGQTAGESKFSFNLSDDPGDSGEESSRSKVSHIDLSSDEE